MADKTKKDKDDSPNEPRVFVYGTLKAGKPNFRALEGAEFLGRCCLHGRYTMVSLGWYPAVIEHVDPTAPVRFISGEVYRVNDDILHTLDIIEGHPNYYTRKKVETPFKKAWVYMLPHQYLAGRTVLEDGMWQPSDSERDFMRSLLSQPAGL